LKKLFRRRLRRSRRNRAFLDWFQLARPAAASRSGDARHRRDSRPSVGRKAMLRIYRALAQGHRPRAL